VENLRLAARDRATGRTGELILQTSIDIRGNPSKGPVPVRFTYYAAFRLDEDSRPHNADRYPELRDFQSEEDRRSFVEAHFAVDSGPLVANAIAHPDRFKVLIGRSEHGGTFVQVEHLPSGRSRSLQSIGSLSADMVAAVLARLLEEEG
jgi:hypothetical protein